MYLAIAQIFEPSKIGNIPSGKDINTYIWLNTDPNERTSGNDLYYIYIYLCIYDLSLLQLLSSDVTIHLNHIYLWRWSKTNEKKNKCSFFTQFYWKRAIYLSFNLLNPVRRLLSFTDLFSTQGTLGRWNIQIFKRINVPGHVSPPLTKQNYPR